MTYLKNGVFKSIPKVYQHMDDLNETCLQKDGSVSRRDFLKSAIAAVAASSLIGNPAYVIGSSLQKDTSCPKTIRLDLNENPLGPSPRAIAEVLTHLSQANRYLCPAIEAFYTALSQYHGISSDMILLGTGSTEILRMAPMAYYEVGGNVVSTLQTFKVLLNFAECVGLSLKTVAHWIDDQGGWHYDPGLLLGAVDAHTRLVYLVNPNNPTGAWLSLEELQYMADELPSDILFLIDEAYIDFMSSSAQSAIDLVKEGCKNIMVTRTFSKVYGLAGLRVGYGVAHPDVIERFKGLTNDFESINTAGFYGAMAALKHTRFKLRCVLQAQKTLSLYKARLPELGYESIIGQGPFVMIHVPTNTEAVVQQMAEMNVLVADGNAWDMPEYIRISYGTDMENECALNALRHVLHGRWRR
jgi:histidinol-phosphate aminotransferase